MMWMWFKNCSFGNITVSLKPICEIGQDKFTSPATKIPKLYRDNSKVDIVYICITWHAYHLQLGICAQVFE